MEANKTTCPDCGHVHFWVGFKTGLGKTEAQLAQMRLDETTCVKCGSRNARTELDHESAMGRSADDNMRSLLSGILGIGTKDT